MTSFFEPGKVRLAPWLDGSGAEPDIIISTRARLARNLSAYPFTGRASESDKRSIDRLIRDVAQEQSELGQGWFLDLTDLSPTQRRCLLEMRLASAELIRDPARRSLLVGTDLTRTLMVNEEDHLRLQAFRPGLDPDGALVDVLALYTRLESNLDLAFSPELGYLTAKPEGMGTGVRLSVHAHLPGLVLAGEIEKILNAMRQMRYRVTGIRGTDSPVLGSVFQISTMVTLGRSEAEIAADCDRMVAKVVHYERMARAELLEKNPLGVADQAQRGLAMLRSARLMTGQEACDLLSGVRLGVALDILPELSYELLNRALVGHQTAHLELTAGRALPGQEKTAARADWLRRLFSGNQG